MINNLNYNILDNILIDIRENINDTNLFKIINNELQRINKIENYEYNFNDNIIYYKKLYDENSQEMIDIINNINNMVLNNLDINDVINNVRIELLKIINNDKNIENIEIRDVIKNYK